MNRIEDLEDIIKILVDMLQDYNVSQDIIKLKLREYHYCFDCMNHYRSCKCDELSNSDVNSSSDINDNYTSSSNDDSDDSDDSEKN